jgi:DNA repair exonuclease SbcCD ATPase subunit
LDPDKFKCYSDLAKAFIIIGYIFSFFSFLFSVYKARIVVRERVQRLQAAGIRPTLKRIVFVERALANHSKRMLLPLADHCSTLPFRFTGPGNGAGALGESGSGSDVAGNTVRDLQRQVAQLQEHHEQQLQQLRQEMQQQQQQQQQLHEQQLQQLRQEMHQQQQQQQQLHEQQLQQLRQEMQQQKQQQQQQHHEQQLQQLRQDIFQLTQQLQRLQQ